MLVFEITVSLPLDARDVNAALLEIVAPDCRVTLEDVGDAVPDVPGDLWARLVRTEDPDWPFAIDVCGCADSCGLDPYPDLRIAEHLSGRFGVDVLCGTYPFVGALDPQDPYWVLALVAGRWYLASTAGTRLMGPYIGGEGLNNADVRLIRAVHVPW